MKKKIYSALIGLAATVAIAAPIALHNSRAARMLVSEGVTDYYELRMTLHVPVILDNMKSLGKRKFKLQQFRGRLAVHYFRDDQDRERVEMSVPALTNMSYKISGKRVTYETTIADYPVWVAIGSNLTKIFDKASLAITIDADPSYNVGDDEPDNTLIVTLSGSGKQFMSISGFVAGQLGCGCHAYGHVSPTRKIGAQGATDVVEDIASCYGQFRLKWVGYSVD